METNTIVIIILIVLILIWLIYQWNQPTVVEGYGEVAPYQINQALLLQQLERANGPNLYDNSYYDLWNSERRKTGDLIRKKASEIIAGQASCIPFKHVNQCMSECTSSTNCSGFYVDTPSTPESPGKCCLMYNPPFDHKRTNFLDVPNSRIQDTYQTISDFIRRQQLSEGKLVFDKVGREGGDSVYRSNLDRKDCRSMCPKCILGRCPRGYRCKDLRADPRRNYSCMITNEDRYDENEGLTFDSDRIQKLNAFFEVRQDAGIDQSQPEPREELIDTAMTSPGEYYVGNNNMYGYSAMDDMFAKEDLWKNSPSYQFLARVGQDRLIGNSTPNVGLESYQRFMKREANQVKADQNNNLY